MKEMLSRVLFISVLLIASALLTRGIAQTLQYQDSPFGIHPAVPYDEANNIGIKWTRGGEGPYIFWSLVAPQMSGNPNQFQWKGTTDKGTFDYDRTIPAPHNAGLEVMWNIDIQPLGGRNYHKANSWLPADEIAYSNFVKEAVKRYPFIRYWQISNEPVANDKLSDYGKFILITYEAIKEGDSQAKVLIGGTSGLGMPQTINEYKANFDKAYLPLLQDIARLDKRSFDIFDFHWYGDAVDDYARAKEIYGYISQKIGELGIPAPEEYWITEMGTYSGDPKGGEIGRIDWPYQSEKQQAIDVVKRYVYPLTFGIKKIFLAWGLKEGFHYDEGYFDFTGLIYDGKFTHDLGDGVRKLSYYTYKKMTEILEGSDWNNIQTIQELDGIYIYKLTKNGKPIWVAWNDSSVTRTITISGITSNRVKTTEAVSKYESGKDVIDYAKAFRTDTLVVTNGAAALTLGQRPVFVEAFTLTSVEEEGENIPHEFLLYQNYPNPFNPITHLRFTIADLRFVTLKVFDVLGREVATLVNGVLSPGEHSVVFDANGLASGVYFYQLRASNFVQQKKMVVMR